MATTLTPVPLDTLDLTSDVLDGDLLYLTRSIGDLDPGEEADKALSGQALYASLARKRRVVQLVNGGATATVVIIAIDRLDKLADLSVENDGGSALVVGQQGGVQLLSIGISYPPGYNPGSTWSFRYPAPYNEQSLDELTMPELRYWSYADPSVMQPLTLQNCTLDGGIVQIQRTGLSTGTAARWKLGLV